MADLNVTLSSVTESGGSEVYPVSAAEAKSYLRYADSDDDTMIANHIRAATYALQRWMGQRFVNGTFTQRFQSFPVSDGGFIIARPPLVSVTSIAYVDEDGDSQNVSTDVYAAQVHEKPGRIRLKYDQSWPTDVRAEPWPITVTFVAGYGTTGASVPEEIRQAILRMVSNLYDGREMFDNDVMRVAETCGRFLEYV